MKHIKLFESFKKNKKESLEEYFERKRHEDLSIPYSKSERIPFSTMGTPAMNSYFKFQAENLLEPRLLDATRFVEPYNGAMVPVKGHPEQKTRHLGLLTYDFKNPIELKKLERFKKMFKEIASDQYPNFTIFTDSQGNPSAAWGDKDKVKFLIDKFSSDAGLDSLTVEDHKKLGEWFGYKPEMTERWIKKNAK